MEKKHILDYLAQAMTIFGSTLFAIAVISYLIGEEARTASSMFALGSDGIPLHTVFQYLLSSVCIVALRILFFSDIWIKKISTAVRTISMLLSVIACIGIFSYCFGWFPVSNPVCWGIFLICFACCFVVSLFVSIWKEHLDNQKLADALQKLKEADDESMD